MTNKFRFPGQTQLPYEFDLLWDIKTLDQLERHLKAHKRGWNNYV